MRKIFLLFAGAILAALSANAQNVVATAGQNVNLRLSPYGYVYCWGVSNYDDRGLYGFVYDGKYEYMSFYDPEYEWQFYTITAEGSEYFNIEGCGHLYDMTYDGEYAYGGEGTSNVLYCVGKRIISWIIWAQVNLQVGIISKAICLSVIFMVSSTLIIL